MDERQIYNEINGLLEETDYSLEIKSVADLEDFLNDEENRKFEVYDEIVKLYDDLLFLPEDDRYSEE